MAGVLQLVRQGDDALSPAERDAEQPGQGGDHLDGLLIAARLGHPNDGIQSVIEEVGIDLGLEDLQLTSALLPLLLDDVVHQVPHGGHHGPDRVAQALHLIATSLLDLHVLPARLQLLDGLLQTADRIRDMGRYPKIQKGHEEDREQQQGQPTKESINEAMKAAANESFGYNTDEIVSSDIVGMRYGSLFDATQTMVLPIDENTSEVQVVSWYDNENSYTSQMVRTIKHFGKLLNA